MAGVYSLSAETSLIFLEHYTTRLTREKLQCTYTDHLPSPSFTCTLSISIPPRDFSSLSSTSTTSVQLTCTSLVCTQKKQAKAAAALMLCHQLIDRGEFEPFAVSGQPGKFAFSSKREKRFQAARHSQPTQPVDFAVFPNKATADRTQPTQSQTAAASSSSPAPTTSPPSSDKERPRDRMVLLAGLDAEKQTTANEITQRLSIALPLCPTVHPFESPVHAHLTAYLLHFNSSADAEEAVTLLDGRDDVVDGQRLVVHMLDKPHEIMVERAWYPAPRQLTEDWLRAEEWDETGVDYYFFYAYRCGLFDAGSPPYSLVLLCPAALPATQPLPLYPPPDPLLTADEYGHQRPRQFDVQYAGSCRLSVEEMGVATTWWARMSKDLANRGSGQWFQEQRRYLILPVMRNTATVPALHPPASDAVLISSFSANHNDNNSPAHVTPDWALINQCLSDTPARLSYTHFDSDHRTLSSVILTTPHNGLLYLPYSLSATLTARSLQHPGKVDGDHSFAAYFSQHGSELDPASPLIEAQHLPTFAVDLTRPLLPPSSAMAVMLAPQHCHVHPVPLPLWRQLRCVPSFIYALESQLLTLSLLEACGTPITSLSLLQAALKSRAVTSEWDANYERLEFLGDSFIKYSVSSNVFSTHSHLPAEHLTRIRVTNICNRNLATIGQHKALLSAIRAPFQPAKMSLAGVASVDSGHLSTGVVADVVEAVVGAYYLEQGEAAARKVAHWLGLPAYQLDGDSQVLTPPALTRHEAAEPVIVDFLLSSVPHLEHVLSYSFRNPRHLLHALTHSSAVHSFNYERLEWLGDAVLDWLVTQTVFTSSPNRSPGEMTACRRSMVNRDSYAILTVQLGLHRHLLAGQQVAGMAAESAVDVVGRWGVSGSGYEADGGASLTSFKVLCDLLESVMGAVFVDCGMDVAETKRVWDGIAAVEETSTGMRLSARRRDTNEHTSSQDRKQHGLLQQL